MTQDRALLNISPFQKVEYSAEEITKGRLIVFNNCKLTCWQVTCNPNTWEVDRGTSLSLKPAFFCLVYWLDLSTLHKSESCGKRGPYLKNFLY